MACLPSERNQQQHALWAEIASEKPQVTDRLVTWTALKTDTYTKCKPVYQQEGVSTILTEYKDVFSDKPGRTSVAQITIKTGDAKPVCLPPYHLAAAAAAAKRVGVVQEEARQLLHAGIIEKSDSPWAAPVVLVPKKDSTLRLCINYRCLNKETKPDPYLMPQIYKLLDGL